MSLPRLVAPRGGSRARPSLSRIGGQLRHHGLPQLGVAQAHALLVLLQAGNGVVGPPVAHAGRFRPVWAAAPALSPRARGAQQRVGGRRTSSAYCRPPAPAWPAAPSAARRDEALAGLEGVARSAAPVSRASISTAGLGAGAQLGRGGHHPGQPARPAGCPPSAGRVKSGAAWRGCHFHLHGAPLVVLRSVNWRGTGRLRAPAAAGR